MSIVLLALLAALPPDPVAEAWRILERGDITEAKALIANTRRLREHKARADFLAARVLMLEGNPAEAIALLDRTPELRPNFGPWADLLAAEAQLRAGNADKSAAIVRPLLARPSFNRHVDERCVHYLLMRDALGHAPDEPNGIASQILLGARLAERLQLGWVKKTPNAITVNIDERDYQCTEKDPPSTRELLSRIRQLRYRITHSPLMALVSDINTARETTAYNLAVFLPPPSQSPMARAVLTEALLPLLGTKSAMQSLYVMVLFCTPEEGQFTAAAAEVNAATPAGDVLLLRTSLEHAFSAHGIMRPPYCFLTSRDRGNAIIDWEPPWGNPFLFFARVRERLGEKR
jgi:tetratricopeptide (TPR) repeat protein